MFPIVNKPKTLANVTPEGVNSVCARDYFVLDNSE